jgi:CRP/FNR family cyclic AMP-dependent transcriptional regulator
MSSPVDLADSLLFRGLDLEQLAALYRISEMEAVLEGDQIFAEGDPARLLYVLIEGAVRISITTPSGGEEALAILQPGDSFGEMGLIDAEPRPRSAHAIAHRPSTVLTIDHRQLHALLERDHAIGFVVMQNLLRYLADKMRQTNQKILFLTSVGMFE